MAKYIYQQSKAFEKKLAEKDAALEEASISLSEAEARASSYADHEETVKRLLPLTETLLSKNASIKDALRQGANDLGAIESGYKDLQEHCEKLEAFREKAKKFDSLASALSGIFGKSVSDETSEAVEIAETENSASPIDHAKVRWDEIQELAKAMGDTCDEIALLISEFKD